MIHSWSPVSKRMSYRGSTLQTWVVLGVYRMGACAVAAMTTLQTVAMLSALVISAGLLAYSLVLQMVPGSRHMIPPRFLPVGITIALTIAIVVLFQFQHERNFWRN